MLEIFNSLILKRAEGYECISLTGFESLFENIILFILQTCSETLGCLSFNFLSTGDGTRRGTCVVVAPSGSEDVEVSDMSDPGWKLFVMSPR